MPKASPLSRSEANIPPSALAYGVECQSVSLFANS